MASKSKTATKHFTHYAIANSVRKGDVVLLQGDHACKIVELEKSKTGKHGGMKVHFVGLDIFSDKKYTGLVGSQDNVTLVDVRKDDMMLVDITDDGYLSVLDGADTRGDLKVPEGELGEKLKASFDADNSIYVTVLAAVGKEMVIAFKNVQDKSNY